MRAHRQGKGPGVFGRGLRREIGIVHVQDGFWPGDGISRGKGDRIHRSHKHRALKGLLVDSQRSNRRRRVHRHGTDGDRRRVADIINGVI